MAETKSKVTQATSNGTWNGKDGTTYYRYEIHFENGDYGEYSSKSANQDKFVVGQEAEYTRSSREYNGTTYYNVKPVYASGGGGYGGRKADPAKDKRIAKLAVLKSATELVCAGKVNADKLFVTADKMMDWVYAEDSKPEAKSAPVQNSAPPSDAVSDLPF